MNIEVFPAIYCLKMRIDFLRFSNYAIYPPKGSPDAAGYDPYSMEEVIASPSSIRIIPTDVGFKTKGYYGKIHSRSSFAMQCTDVGEGVIDSDCRGPVYVVFFNFSSRYFELQKGLGK